MTSSEESGTLSSSGDILMNDLSLGLYDVRNALTAADFTLLIPNKL